MKRFWREVRVVRQEHGTAIELDRRPLRTPARRPLVAPTAALAEVIAGEWRAQEDRVEPRTMPATRLASTVIDRMPGLRDVAIEEILAIARTDLVCYRADRPDDLVRRQEQAWQPIVDWLAREYGASLEVTRALFPVAQPEPSITRLRESVDRFGDWHLVGLHAAVQLLGSLALGLALEARRLEAAEAVDRSLLDELYEIETWGWDIEIDRRHRALHADVDAAAGFLATLDEEA
jgi:chaperone required for assembly of F1-ATPase